MTCEFILVRHGETESNAAGLLHGRTDVPLNAVGQRQATQVADHLASIGRIVALYASPLTRARATADPISRSLGLTTTERVGLAEIDFGAIEGLPAVEFATRYPELFARLQNPTGDDAGFPRGESILAFHERVHQSLRFLASEHRGERIVVVAHGGVIASGIAQLIGNGPAAWSDYLVRNCSVTRLTWDGERAELHCLDDVSHLAAAVGPPR